MQDFLLIASLYLAFSLVELFFPAQSDHSASGRVRNIVYSLLLLLVGGMLATAAYTLLPFRVREVSADGPLAIAIYVAAYLFLIDFFFYCYHRAQHAYSALWQLHELHHSDEELNATSSHRTYWLDLPMQTVFVSLPTFLIVGLEPIAFTISVALAAAMLVFAHANLRLNLGVLTPIIVGPQLHRIHHSNETNHRDKNFAQFFPIFDIVFGTYYAPRKDEFPATGTDHLRSDASFATVLLNPFKRWVEMLKRR